MSDSDNEYKKSSLRSNAIEKKRLEIIKRTIDKAKQNLAVDMRRSQASYRQRLRGYRERQKEIMQSRAPVPPTVASVGEFLLRQLTSRQSQSCPLMLATLKRPQTAQPSSHRSISTPRPLSFAARMKKSGHSRSKSAGTSSPSLCQRQPGLKHNMYETSAGQESQTSRKPRPQTAHNKGTRSIFPVNKSFLNTASEQLKEKDPFTPKVDARDIRTQRPKTVSSVSFKHHEVAKEPVQRNHAGDEDLSNLNDGHVNRFCESSSPELGNPEASDHDDIENEAEKMQEEYEANIEFGRASKRQRSKLDLRPSTAWGRLNGNVSPNEGQQVAYNPFLHMKGSLGGPSRQVRYFDKDEIEERGAFYRFLVENRLRREHTRFQDICARIDQFCNVSSEWSSDEESEETIT